jgi:two-component system NtrC family sensor kinase
MNGLDLANAIRERFPHLPVLLSTGYSSSAQEAIREGFLVLQKPFEFSALEQSVRETLRDKEPLDRVRKERLTS